MIAPRSLISFAPRRRSLAELSLVAFAIVVLVVRACETPPSTVGALRMLGSALAIGFLCFSSYKTIARRAMTVLAFEALVGLVAFAYVDVPFVLDHQRQIGFVAISISDSVARFEHAISAIR